VYFLAPPNLRTHYGGLDGIIFVYDIAKKGKRPNFQEYQNSSKTFVDGCVLNPTDSLTNLTEWIKECGWYAPAGTIKMIVGNKSDRKQDRAFEKSAGKVSPMIHQL
jgi:GTPase SAR1 family protein